MKLNLQLFGGRGGGSGLGAGGQGGAGGGIGVMAMRETFEGRESLSLLETFVDDMSGRGISKWSEDEPLARMYRKEVVKVAQETGYVHDKEIVEQDARDKINTLGKTKNTTINYVNGDGQSYTANVEVTSERRNGYTQKAYRVVVDNKTTGQRDWYQYYDTASQARNAVADHSGISRKAQSRRR